jgi:hypothetical protein
MLFEVLTRAEGFSIFLASHVNDAEASEVDSSDFWPVSL